MHKVRSTLIFVLLALAFGDAQGVAPVLSIQRTQDFGWHRILGTADAAQVYTILGSTNLSNWNAIATLLDCPGTNSGTAFFSFLDPASSILAQRFYRLLTQAPTPTNDWKNQVYFPNDAFADTNVIPGNPRPIKFAIDLQEPFRVYYQNAGTFPFHYDFAVERLGRFQGMERSEFDAVSLYTNNQQIVLGAVLLPPLTANARDVGIQFVGLDAYPPEKIHEWFRLVRSTIVDVPPNAQVFYMPSLEQMAAAEAARAYFASNGIQISSPDIWVQGDSQIYAAGWALGRLKFFSALEIRTAFNEGRLRPQDILVTDGVPAEIPLLAGVITLVPTTPNSHVALLARSYGIPFVYIADPDERARIRSLADREVIFRARPVFSLNQPAVKIVEVEGSLTAEFRAELLGLKAPPTLTIVPMATFGATSASTTNLTPADIRYFGGKAANFGVLRRTLPTNSPDAIAFSFDLWNQFLDQTLPGGQTLRETINQRLSGYTYPPDLATLRTNLSAVRNLIRQTAQFAPAQRQAITNALSRFDSRRNIRFRSSTNLEDTESFIGAGLYDSYSGCLADDLDDDSVGPSICDPTENDERGVFRAIQRVYASFFNDDAFIERLRLRVNEAEVGMAVLVHYSFPDTIEMANGVATVDVRPNMSHAVLNTQVGAESVTNPNGSSLPEIVEIDRYSFGTYPSLVQTSTRLATGEYVLAWDSEYRQLMDMFVQVANAYAAQFTNKHVFQLDFEYKKVEPGVLEIKQVREVPPPPSTNLPAPYLINEPANFVVLQGECSSVFELHHLKSRLHVETLNTRLDRTNTTFLSNASFEFLDGTNVITTTGSITNWPGFSHKLDSSGVIDTWSYGAGANQRTFSLRIDGARPAVVSSSDPIRFISDYAASLSAVFATPVPDISLNGVLTWRTDADVCLVLDRPVATNDPIYAVGVNKGSRSIGGSFYTPYYAQFLIIKTIPLLKWIGASVSGFTSQTIPLADYYALTFRARHHNFNNDFIVEPRLEPLLSPSQRAELASQNIKLLYGYSDDFGPSGRLFILGFDNTVREVQ